MGDDGMPNASEQVQRIEKAAKAMKAIFKKQKMTIQQLKAADGIIKRVAFMQITLEDLEKDINQKQCRNAGYPLFRPGNPDRKRPCKHIPGSAYSALLPCAVLERHQRKRAADGRMGKRLRISI